MQGKFDTIKCDKYTFLLASFRDRQLVEMFSRGISYDSVDW